MCLSRDAKIYKLSVIHVSHCVGKQCCSEYSFHPLGVENLLCLFFILCLSEFD